MFLHEFLFLVANALDRQIVLTNVKMQKINTEKESIGTHEGVKNYAGRKLDKIYQYDIDKRKVRQNPKLLMANAFNIQEKNIKIDNQRPQLSNALEKEILKQLKTQEKPESIKFHHGSVALNKQASNHS